MPGPVSDSHDPEWGTSTNAAEIEELEVRAFRDVAIALRNCLSDLGIEFRQAIDRSAFEQGKEIERIVGDFDRAHRKLRERRAPTEPAPTDNV